MGGCFTTKRAKSTKGGEGSRCGAALLRNDSRFGRGRRRRKRRPYPAAGGCGYRMRAAGAGGQGTARRYLRR